MADRRRMRPYPRGGRISGFVRADSPLFSPRARPRARHLSARATLFIGAGLVVVLALLVGLVFAGSRQELAPGTYVAGVDVGGLPSRQAVAQLEQAFAKVEAEPVKFAAGDETFTFAANQLGVEPDWGGAVAAAARAGDGFGPIRGFRRLHTRFFGAEILPRVAVSDGALDYRARGHGGERSTAPRRTPRSFGTASGSRASPIGPAAVSSARRRRALSSARSALSNGRQSPSRSRWRARPRP